MPQETSDTKRLPLGHEFEPRPDDPFGFQLGKCRRCGQGRVPHEPPSAAREPVTDHEFEACPHDFGLCPLGNQDFCHYSPYQGNQARKLCKRLRSEHRPIEQGASAPETERCGMCEEIVAEVQSCSEIGCPVFRPRRVKEEPSPPEPPARCPKDERGIHYFPNPGDNCKRCGRPFPELPMTEPSAASIEAVQAVRQAAAALDEAIQAYGDKRAADAVEGRCSCKYVGEVGREKFIHVCQLHCERELRVRADAVREDRTRIAKDVRDAVKGVGPYRATMGLLELADKIERGEL